ncbi:MAG TPA: PQQ-dependent sugar dehydrogenase, partial [Rhodoblastus sp.]|nr:PQQ-dependent sugar dehydrogenase [Rhodoblastus sp.]
SATLPRETAGFEQNGGDEVLSAENFRSYGLLVQEIGAVVRIFISHDYWHADRSCFVERVSLLEGDRAAILRGAAGPVWKTLFETSPCLPVRGERRRHGIPFVGYLGGGRIQLLDPQTILLSVGDFGFDGVASVNAVAQDRSTSYGKTIAINIADGRASIFTFGHRNPEGLFIDRAGMIWETEHGPHGGDKLNLLKRGANYGWPYATFGTDYGSFNWPLNKPESEWRDYQQPVFAWVPSIAVSNLVVVENALFSRWCGDLLIGSLKDKTLFRAHVKDGHVIYLESMFIGARIRDLIEGHDGRILMWTDDNTLISISPDAGTTGEALFAEKCSGCHQSTAFSGNRIGPNLSGVVGRRIASLSGYPDYSPALRHLGGVWEADRLNAFLKQPTVACPGTHMDIAGIADDKQRSTIINYLGTLH